MKAKELKSKNIIESFRYAVTGIINSFKERNLKIQLFVMIMVVLLGLHLKISMNEWFVCIILFALVIGAEIFNTAIENAVDFIEKNRNDNPWNPDENAKLAKDASAGAVLVVSIASAVIGLMIFLPKILVIL
ncbi:MAG: diacylglycerol kinase family protein [Methanosphaera sp.]|nr:diacylglycerol kinase family protein [Methanosphaera sp.]